MQDHEFGHESGIRQQTFVLNRPFTDDLGPDLTARFCQVLVDLAAEATGHTQDQTEALLRQRLADLGVELPEVSYAIRAEQLFRSQGHIAIVTDRGEVLYGPPESSQMRHQPDIEGMEDPAAPHRPFLS